MNEKKVYALVSEGSIPATRLTGKWLFPRELVDQWMLESSHGGLLTDRMVIAGSDDPLLYRALMLLAAELGGQTLGSQARRILRESVALRENTYRTDQMKILTCCLKSLTIITYG